MASRLPRALLSSMPALLCCGCLTGHLLEGSRIGESVSEYELALREPDRLLLRYRATLEDRDGTSMGFAHRAVALPLTSLQAQPELPVDAFPVEPLRLEDPKLNAGSPLLLRLAGEDAPPRGDSGNTLEVEVDPATGRHSGFRLLGDDLDGPARFHSGALYRTRHAWWAYPLLPLCLVGDVLLFVPELVFATPLMIAGE